MRNRQFSRQGMGRGPLLVVALIALGVVWASGCGDDPTDPPPPPRPTAITVTPATSGLTALGATAQLTAEVRDQNGQVLAGAAVTWASDGPEVATVDAAGLVTAVNNGTATVTASAGTVSGSAVVTVAQEASAAEVSPVADTVHVGDTLRIAAEATDANGHAVEQARFVWASSDASVATVDESGLVRGVATGVATITATSADANAEARITVHQVDRAVLVALYETTNGPDWVEDDGWLSDRPVGEWYGVTTGESGRVTGLRLMGNNLTGPIAPELALLSHLEVVDLERNLLEGPIPAVLGSLPELRHLDLRVNYLTGGIPPELGQLANLEFLRLGRNALTGAVPAELSNLRNIERLGIERNRLTGVIPLGVGNLDQLRIFHFSENAGLCISGSPDFVAWLARLALYVGPLCNEGDLERLSSFFGATGGGGWTRRDGWGVGDAIHEWHGVTTDSLGRVATLDLSDNGLVGGIPASVAEFGGLRHLRIGGNRGLSGPLPISLMALALEDLQYADTDVCVPGDRSFGEWLAALPSHEGTGAPCAPLSERAILELLFETTGGEYWIRKENWLSDRPLGEWEGVTTDEDGRVVGLNLGVNAVWGVVPPELGQLGSLRELVLDNNILDGPIPPQLANLTNLETLRLAGNWLSGPIPAELGGLPRLSTLMLANNALSGPIPPELGQLSSLTVLDLHGASLTSFTGPIPSELGALDNLEWLSLAWNRVAGPIPPELGALASLSHLNLSRNELTGPIPPELGALASLSHLNLSRNDLTGPIPPELGALASLSHLNLSGNDLAGPVPAELGASSTLSVLDLGNNDLAGPIPPELGDLPLLTELDLVGNRLAGPIPPELGTLSELRRLHLDDNGLAGSIPPDLGNLSRLELLSVMRNQLSGSIPPELGGLTDLKQLRLTNNAEMSGIIPSDLTALTGLQELLLTGTALCAPPDPAFREWLSNVSLSRVGGCGAGTGPSAYLTQGVQSVAAPVPLVANREALLRVLATATRATSEGIPKVLATFYHGGVETHAVEIPASDTPIPTDMEDAEGSLARSANARIPGSVIRPGLEMVIEIDPDGTLDPGLGVTGRIPETGRLPVDVETLPPLDLTFVPFLWLGDSDSSIVDLAQAMAAQPDTHEMLGDTRAMLPVADLDVKAHAPVLTSSNGMGTLYGQTSFLRAVEGASGYYMGIMSERVVGGESGLAAIGGHVSVSAATPYVISHELGHNLGLRHAPCGGASGPDPAFPQAGATIGIWGYDFRGPGLLVPPHTADVMSYCSPRWISDFSFVKSLNHRRATESATVADHYVSADAPARSLLLWGGVDAQGVPFLMPAFVVDAPPTELRSTGDYQLVGRAAGGDELFSARLDMVEMADGDGGSSFVVALPLGTGWDALDSVILSGPGGSATMDRTTDRPMAILRDPGTGQIRAFLRDVDATNLMDRGAAAAGPGVLARWDVAFSRGVPDTAGPVR